MIVTALGGVSRICEAALIPQAAELLVSEDHERGRTVVLVLHEAHLLATDQLEELRLLTNAEVGAHSPFAGPVVGQPIVRREIELGSFAGREQRIALRYAMIHAGSVTYLGHHLKLAGRSATLFSDDATA